MDVVRTEPMTSEAFAPFGEVLEVAGEPDKIINQGHCGRWHDLAALDVIDGRVGLSLFKAKPRALPYKLDMLERHPEGSQAFVPMSQAPFLVVVARDADDRPGTPRAFLTTPGQGVNYHRGVWHGVLTPLAAPGLFAVIDRIGDGANLEEHWLDRPVIIEA
ncbi:MAG: ureidoglycolate lyase [Geminicoccaceae bacterium]|jgi:ureidoglycolate lyase